MQPAGEIGRFPIPVASIAEGRVLAEASATVAASVAADLARLLAKERRRVEAQVAGPGATALGAATPPATPVSKKAAKAAAAAAAAAVAAAATPSSAIKRRLMASVVKLPPGAEMPSKRQLREAVEDEIAFIIEQVWPPLLTHTFRDVPITSLDKWRDMSPPVAAVMEGLSRKKELWSQSRAMAEALTTELIEFVCKEVTGFSAAEVRARAAAEEHARTLARPIPSSSELDAVRGATAYLAAHKEMRGGTTLQRARDFLGQLDDQVRMGMPGIGKVQRWLENGKVDRIVQETGEITRRMLLANTAAKPKASKAQKAQVAAAPAKEDRGSRKDHTEGKSKEREKRPLKCHNCGKTDGHLALRCPDAVCLRCNGRGHLAGACAQPETTSKDNSRAYSSISAAAAAERSYQTLVVEGSINGVPALLGLDPMAGATLVEARAVPDAGLSPSQVQLEAVGGSTVPSLGTVEVQLQVGNVTLTETAEVVEELPGVQALVSCEALRDVGLVLTKDGVTVGGQPVTLAEPWSDLQQAAMARAEAKTVREERRATSDALVDMARTGLNRTHRLAGVELENGRLHGYHVEERQAKEKTPSRKAGGPGGWTSAGRQAPRGQRTVEDRDAVESEEEALDRAMAEAEAERTVKAAEKAVESEEEALDRAMAEAEAERTVKAAEKAVAAAAAVAQGAYQAATGAEQADALGDRPRVAVGAAPAVRTVQAVEHHYRTGEWLQEESKDVLGTDMDAPELVDQDDFCVPEDRGPGWREKYEAKVRDLLAKADYQDPTAREAHVQVMLKRWRAYSLGMDDFQPGMMDVPELVLHATPGPPIVDAMRQRSPEDTEWLRKMTEEFDAKGLWEPVPRGMEGKVFVSNVVIVKTRLPDGEVKRRITVDFWGPNSRITPPPQSMPNVADLADRAGKAELFDKDDGMSGYYQWRLAKESKYLTAVYTPLGLRWFCVMPMGINVAPAEWTGAMLNRFGNMPVNRLFNLMDDFVRMTASLPGETRSAMEHRHVALLDEFLGRVEQAHMRLKLDKAVHAVEELEALGLMFGRGRVWKTDDTTTAIREYPVPKSGKQLERFLALGQYYGNFVAEYSRLVAPLRALARKARWDKGELAQGTGARAVFEQVRNGLVEQVRLSMPDWAATFMLKTDWSPVGVAAILLQKDKDGVVRPVAFASRKCTRAEAKMDAPDGEVVALVWGVKRFEKYLEGRRFEAYVDQESLSWLKDKRLNSIGNRRLQGAYAYLRQFAFTIHYRKAAKMRDVDALTRAFPELEEGKTVVVDVEEQGEEEVRVAAAAARLARKKKKTKKEEREERGEAEAARVRARAPPTVGSVAQVDMEGAWGFETELRSLGELQRLDPTVAAIRQLMSGQKLAEINTDADVHEELKAYLARDTTCSDFVDGADGRLYHIWHRRINEEIEVVRQLFVPVVMRGRLVVSKHGSAAGGHRAAAEVVAKLKKRYFWPTMDRDVEAWVAGCGCQRRKGDKVKRVGDLQSMKVVRPGEKIVFDFFGPLPVSTKGNAYLLVMMDVGTREMMLKGLPTRKAVGVARTIFNRVYLRGMAPRVFQSDNAKEFVSEVMVELTTMLGAKFRHSSPYHPQTNTHVERYNRTLATNLSLLIQRDDQRDWDQHLKLVQYSQLVGAQEVLGRLSPLFLKGGWDAMDPIDRAMDVDDAEVRDKTLAEWMAGLQRARQLAMQSQALAAARDVKRMALKVKQLDAEVGQEVWVVFPNVGKGRSRKLAFRLHGPYILESWVQEAKRTAWLVHKDDPKDKIMAHVDRIVRKKAVPQALREAWKPIRLELVKEATGKGRKKVEKEKEEDGPPPLAADAETQAEIDKELDDQDYVVERILDHDETSDKGRVQYKVRFAGYGPEHDLWFYEEDLVQSAPEVVRAYKESEEKRHEASVGGTMTTRSGRARVPTRRAAEAARERG